METGPERTKLEGKSGVGRILSKDLFLYFLDHEIKRALRYQNFLSVLLLRLVPCSKGDDAKGLQNCCQTLRNVMNEEMRETDVLGFLAENKWAALLPYADGNAGDQAKIRFENTLKYYDFRSWGYDVMVQQFTFPKTGTDTVEVIKRAMNAEPIRKL
jgi:hypothetical protein